MACKINITLPSGFSMPALGYGTWQSKDKDLEVALEAALEAGYRHIDTAYAYDNEHVIGKVLKKWMDAGKLKREDLFIVTKLPPFGIRAAEVEQYINGSLEKLQLSYVDLYLVHCPFGCYKVGDNIGDWKIDLTTDHLAVWREMEKQVEKGKTKYIGVSNFNIKQVDRILKNSKILPVTNQVELHVYLQQPELVEFCQKNNVTITSYSTLGTPGSKATFEARGLKIDFPIILENPVVGEIAKKHRKTPAQVLLRHLIQKNIAVIPKSVNPERVKQNINVFDFNLDSDDMQKLNNLNINKRLLVFSEIFKGSKDHPEYPFEV